MVDGSSKGPVKKRSMSAAARQRLVRISCRNFHQVVGAPGPSPLGTGEEKPIRRGLIHSGSCQPLSRAVHSDSISTVPLTPV